MFEAISGGFSIIIEKALYSVSFDNVAKFTKGYNYY